MPWSCFPSFSHSSNTLDHHDIMSQLSQPPFNQARVALAHAVHFFTPEFAQTLVTFAPEVDVPEHVGRYLTEKVVEYPPFIQAQGREPGPVSVTSVDQFLGIISSTFSSYYIDDFRNNCKNFDHLVGSGSLSSGQAFKPSDVLIRELDLMALTSDICKAIAYRAWDVAFCLPKPYPVRPTPESYGTPQSCGTPQSDGTDDPSSASPQDGVSEDGGPFEQAVAFCLPKPCPIRPIPQFDGTDDPASDSPQAGVSEDGGPFKQVTLVGANLLEAWQRLQFTRQLEQACPQSSTWTPSQPGGFFVYHGTWTGPKRTKFLHDLTHRPFIGLTGQSNPNQITHGTHDLPVIWTAFSPFRAFLWAVFRADVVMAVPHPTAQSELNATWRAGGRVYEGVILLQFRSTQPHPSGLTSYAIPSGQEEQWARIVNAEQYLPPIPGRTRGLWAHFAGVHGQSGESDWPNLVHGMDLPVSRQALGPSIRQFWRTVWSGQGIRILNESHHQSLAIRFFKEEDQGKGQGSRRGRVSVGGSGKLRTLIKKRLSRMDVMQPFRKI